MKTKWRRTGDIVRMQDNMWTIGATGRQHRKGKRHTDEIMNDARVLWSIKSKDSQRCKSLADEYILQCMDET